MEEFFKSIPSEYVDQESVKAQNPTEEIHPDKAKNYTTTGKGKVAFERGRRNEVFKT